MMMRDEDEHSNKAIDTVRALVESWNCSYVYSAREDPSAKSLMGRTFITTWSKPTKEQPAPPAVVFIYLFVVEVPGGFEVEEYRVENERHVHRPGDGIKFNEAWLDRVIERKLKMKNILDLSDDFSRTRMTEPEISDDDEDEEEGEEEAARRAAEEHMGALELEGMMVAAFREADMSNEGALAHPEFRRVLSSLVLGISEEEQSFLGAWAMEDDAGRVDYSAFVSAVLEIIPGFKGRAQEAERRRSRARSAGGSGAVEDIDMSTMVELIKEETQAAALVLQQTFSVFAYSPPSAAASASASADTVSRPNFWSALRNPAANLSAREVNLLMYLSPGGVDGGVPTEGFSKQLQNMRLMFARHAYTFRNRAALQRHVRMVLQRADLKASGVALPDDGTVPDGAPLEGVVTASQLFDALTAASRLALSNVQVLAVMSYAAQDGGDGNGYIEYAPLVPLAASAVYSMYHPEAMLARVRVLPRISRSMLLGGLSKQELDERLFVMFQEFDVDQNGVLDMQEFVTCLQSTELELSEGMIMSIMAIADLNDDGRVDYEEFMALGYGTLLALSKEMVLLREVGAILSSDDIVASSSSSLKK